MRRIHARTSARMGRPMTKRFEPSREREVLIALDVQTVEGAAWEAGFGSDDVESLYVVAGSLARTLGARHVAFGLMAAGYTGAETRIARVAVSSAPGQVQRVLDLLARLSAHASAPFERLLGIVARSVRPGTTVLVLTARDPRPFGPALRRLEQAGADVVVVACGPAGRRWRREGAIARVHGPAGVHGRPLADGRAAGPRAMSAETTETPDTAETPEIASPPGPPRRRDGRMPNPLVLAPIALAILAEAAWTAVLAGLLAAFALRDPTLGIPARCSRASRASPRPAGWRPEPATAGPRSPPSSRSASPPSAGSRRRRRARSSPSAGSTPSARRSSPTSAASWPASRSCVACPTPGCRRIRARSRPRSPSAPRGSRSRRSWAAWSATRGGRGSSAETTTEVVVFLVAGIASLTLSRLTLVGSGAGAGSVDWRRNPAWIGLAALLLAGIATTALATSAVAGPAIVAVLGAAIPSLLVLGFVVGFDRRSLRIVAICLAIALFLGQLLRIIGSGSTPRPAVTLPATVPPADPTVATPLTLVFVGIAVVLAAIAIVILITLWMLRPRVAEEDLDEERWIERDDEGGRDVVRRRRRGSRLGRGRPADAVAAYRMLIEALATRPGVRREEGETPAEHAARLRESGSGALGLDLLAADYGLVRFGGIRLTDAEERRAVRRAGVLRRLLAGDAAQATGGRGPGAAAKPGEDAAPEGGPGTRSRFRVG